MKPYFAKMQEWVKPAKENKANAEEIKKVEQGIAELVEVAKNAGMPAETLNKRGEWTVHQRLEYIVEPGTMVPSSHLV
jgi:glutaconyl-CoA decarboxylase